MQYKLPKHYEMRASDDVYLTVDENDLAASSVGNCDTYPNNIEISGLRPYTQATVR
jgi:hypothetical protein